MGDLSDIDAAQAVKLVGADASGVEQTPVLSTAAGGLHSNLRDAAGNELLGRKIPSGSISTVGAEPQTYSAAIAALVTAAASTDVFTITGSASKTIRITKVSVSGNSTTSAWYAVVLLKRSTANSGGTSTTLTNVPNSSANAAATAVVRAYTANPTLGTLVGNMYVKRANFSVRTPTNAQGVGSWPTAEFLFDGEPQPIVLNGTSEVLAINFNGATVAGPLISIHIEWTEE